MPDIRRVHIQFLKPSVRLRDPNTVLGPFGGTGRCLISYSALGLLPPHPPQRADLKQLEPVLKWDVRMDNRNARRHSEVKGVGMIRRRIEAMKIDDLD